MTYYNQNAWASDFVDCNYSSGEDCYYTDTNNVAIYDGHGNTRTLWFSCYHNGYCGVNGASYTELGRYTSATTALFISTACCYMHLSVPDNFTDHGGLNQQLGFGGEASMDTGMMDNYYNASNGTNWYGWISEMEDKPGWFTGDNTTVAFTRGSTPTDVTNNRNVCGLKRGTCNSRIGYTVGSYWQYDYYDHGASGCNAP